MTPEQFAYWFQGFAELNEAPPDARQWQMMRDHVATVFQKETPPRPAPPSSTVTLDELRPIYEAATRAADRGLRRRVGEGRLIC